MRQGWVLSVSFLVLVPLLGIGLFTLPAHAISCDTPEEKAECQRQYDELQKEIAAQQLIITQTEAKKNTLSGNVTQLNAQIKAAQDQIAAKNIAISQLGNQIKTKVAVIQKLSDRIEAGKEALAGIIRQQSQLDDESAVEVALGDQDVSQFFADLDAFAEVQGKMQDLFSDIRTAKAQTEVEKQQLADKQNATQDAKFVIETKKQQVAANKVEQQKLLAITTNQEAEYQKVLAANQAKAAAIRAALFPLRDAAAIQFGDALKYAQAAQAKTGVDAAFILAILTQESNLGANVGQCYVTNDATGDGVGKNTGTAFKGVMNPTRDVPVFLKLAAQLGFDPHHQVVSCPIASAGGWGGAMGPTQFIPSTWALYAARIASARGVPVANPWDPQDAIMATAIYMSDLGAAGGSYTSEVNAAAKYYAGGNWAGSAGQSYGRQVMAKVASIQQNIDFLNNN
jgi:membrane-bound lytic murein transglycosylase B